MRGEVVHSSLGYSPHGYVERRVEDPAVNDFQKKVVTKVFWKDPRMADFLKKSSVNPRVSIKDYFCSGC